VGGQGSDAWAGKSRRWMTAARGGVLRRRQEESEAEQREQGRQEEERGRNRARDYFAISEKNRDLTVKNLQLSSNGDGPKSKSA
jgi:hypothetical protein